MLRKVPNPLRESPQGRMRSEAVGPIGVYVSVKSALPACVGGGVKSEVRERTYH